MPSKKFVSLSWVAPDAFYLRDHLSAVEKQPFDGFMMTLGNEAGNVFKIANWNEADFEAAMQPEVEALKSLRWKKFTDNFLMMHAASDMDWFSDADWDKVTQRVQWMARLARESGTQLVWDSEPYGQNPWEYKTQQHASAKTFAEYSAMVRKRGAQFMSALQSELPKVKLLSLFQMSILSAAMDLPPAQRDAALAEGANWGTQHYGLTAAFLDGMLDAARPNTIIIDGNEGSYYYTTADDFARDDKAMRVGALSLIAPENHAKYKAQVKVAYSVYYDTTMGDYDAISRAVAPQHRLRRLEHNAYHAFANTDEYVWLYTEKADPWKMPYVAEKDRHITPQFWEAIASARTKAAAKQPLGFDVQPIIETAQGRLDAAAAAIVRKSTNATRINAAQRPTIDGKLGEALYQAAPLDNFLGFSSTFEEATQVQPTQTWLSYDEENLYVAFRCHEALLGEQGVFGALALRQFAKKRDQPANAVDDTIEMVLAPNTSGKPSFRFGVNADNIQYDSKTDARTELAFDAAWKSAVQIGAKEWTAEFAIPWQALGLAAPPPAGTKWRVNFNRRRTLSQSYYVTYAVMSELSSWSQFAEGWGEPGHFGILTF